MNWADKIVQNKVERGEIPQSQFAPTKVAIENWLERALKENVKRAGMESDKKWQDEERHRLITLEIERNSRDNEAYRWRKELGTEVQVSYSSPHKITNIKLEFSPELWVDFANTEGEHLGTCCADISAIRDILIDALRNDGDIRANEFKSLRRLMKDHDFSDENPLFAHVEWLWNKVKDHLDDYGLATHWDFEMKTPDDAIRALSYASNIVDFYKFMSGNGNEDCELQRLSHQEKSLALIVQAVHLLKDTELISKSVIEGYGLFKNNQIMVTNAGLAIYSSYDKCFKNNEITEEISIKKIKITCQKGMEILEEF